MMPAGPIKCGDRERRKLLEQLGIEDRVEFIGEADAAGRQADEGDHLDESAGQSESTDPFQEAYADE